MAIAIPNALIEAIRTRTAVLFAGAGISAPSLGWAGAKLRDVVGHKVQVDYPDYDYSIRSLEDVCDEYATLNDRAGLVNLLAAEFPTNAQPSPAHIAAVQCFRFMLPLIGTRCSRQRTSDKPRLSALGHR